MYIYAAQDRVQWWAFKNIAKITTSLKLIFGFRKSKEFLNQLRDYRLLKKPYAHGVSFSYLAPWSGSFMGSRQSLSYSIISLNCMEPEGSMPCLQEHDTGRYPQLGKFSPYHHIIFL
jgi:hypothetical protein